MHHNLIEVLKMRKLFHKVMLFYQFLLVLWNDFLVFPKIIKDVFALYLYDRISFKSFSFFLNFRVFLFDIRIAVFNNIIDSGISLILIFLIEFLINCLI